MPREIHTLSDETRQVITFNPQAISLEMGKHHTHAYDFLYERQTDPFALFLPLYDGAIRAGAPVCYWDNRLAASRSRYAKQLPTKSPAECIKANLNANNETMLAIYAALEDGELSDREAADIQALLDKEIEEATRLRETIGLKRVGKELSPRAYAEKSVASRNGENQ